MNPITLSVCAAEDKQMVIIGAEVESAEVRENRSYFLDPVQSVEIANAILRSAEECGVQIKIQAPPHITDMQRIALIARTEHIMRSLSGKQARTIALQIVDSILAEIL